MTTLKKVLKLRTVISTSAGMALATSCYLAGIQVATILVGELAWLSILIAGAFCLLSAMCFSELTSQYLTAAGIKLFIQNAFNERLAIVMVVAFLATTLYTFGVVPIFKKNAAERARKSARRRPGKQGNERG
jgi:amino acid transporter